VSFGVRRPVAKWRVSAKWKRICRAVKARDHYRCQVCGVPELYRRTATGKRMSNLVVGHKIPPERYAGSPLDTANLWLLCRADNASQGNRTPEEWRAARSGRLVELGLVDPDRPSRVITRDYTKRSYG
jgi:5-methylcytosine-specific restriction endonuclease McrA